MLWICIYHQENVRKLLKRCLVSQFWFSFQPIEGFNFQLVDDSVYDVSVNMLCKCILFILLGMTIDHNYFLFIFQTFYVYKIIKYNPIIPEIGSPKCICRIQKGNEKSKIIWIL